MKYLFSDPVLDKYTWRGTAELAPFKQLTAVNSLIFRSVRAYSSKYKYKSYKNYIVEWIKHSTTRQRTVTYTNPKRKQNENENDDDSDDNDDCYDEHFS